MPDLIFEPASCFEIDDYTTTEPFWVTHTSAWTRVIEKSFPHMNGYIISDNQKIGSENSFLPVYKIKKPFNKVSWLSIPYASISDPVLNSKRSAETFLRKIVSHSEIKNSNIEIRTLNKLGKPEFFTECTEYANHQIKLNGENELELFRRFHRTAVQVHIRKAIESGIVLKTGSSITDVKEFYRVYVLMRRDQGLPPQPFTFFQNMWNELYPTGMVELLLAEMDGKVFSGLWNLKNNWLYSFEYLARAGDGDKLRCAHFLYWHGIRRALQSGTKIVSFARTSLRNKGLDLFKRRWGTEVVPYYDLIYPSVEIKHREDQFLYKLVKSYAKILPVPLFRFLGNLIYKLI